MAFKWGWLIIIGLLALLFLTYNDSKILSDNIKNNVRDVVDWFTNLFKGEDTEQSSENLPNNSSLTLLGKPKKEVECSQNAECSYFTDCLYTQCKCIEGACYK